jgi:hypothetical protein
MSSRFSKKLGGDLLERNLATALLVVRDVDFYFRIILKDNCCTM